MGVIIANSYNNKLQVHQGVAPAMCLCIRCRHSGARPSCADPRRRQGRRARPADGILQNEKAPVKGLLLFDTSQKQTPPKRGCRSQTLTLFLYPKVNVYPLTGPAATVFIKPVAAPLLLGESNVLGNTSNTEPS